MGYYSFWPNRNQELLLAAALSDPDTAIHAWKEWQSRETFETTDSGSRRLMPLVYDNLRYKDSIGSAMDGPRNYYRHIRLTNKLLLFRLEEVLALLETHEIPVMVLKGAALTSQVYRDPGLRPMIDLDIVVPRDFSRRIVDILSEGGWACFEGRPPHPMPVLDKIRTLRFENADGVELDLHFALFEEWLTWHSVLPFWTAAVPLEVGRQSTLTLSATDHLLHVLVHGSRSHRTMSPVRWIADAVWLLRDDVTIDWKRFVDMSKTLRYQYVVSLVLRYLVENHAANVPSAALSALEERPSFAAVLDYGIRSQFSLAALIEYPTTLALRWRTMRLHWQRYAQQNDRSDRSPTVLGFLYYVKARRSFRSVKQTVWHSVRAFFAI
jgi:hypothetical protein